jgi:hypothetical protein
MLTDRELLAEAARSGLDIDGVGGAQMQRLVELLYAPPPGGARPGAQDQRRAVKTPAITSARHTPW